MRRLLVDLSAAALAAAFLAPALSAQTSLGRPEARLPDDFGSIQTVRELPDGRVLVADPLGKALYVVDLDAGTREVVGSEGQGPQEYRQPDAVWPLPGDSTLLVDLGNARLVAVGPGMEFGRTRPISQGDFQPGQPLVLAIPQGVDARGAIYFRSMGSGGMGGELPDTADILRQPLDGGASSTVGHFKVQDRKVSRSGGAQSQNVSIEQIPLSPEDAWGVAADGSVVIARAGDYHVEWVGPDGKVTRGPTVTYRPLGIGTAREGGVRHGGGSFRGRHRRPGAGRERKPLHVLPARSGWRAEARDRRLHLARAHAADLRGPHPGRPVRTRVGAAARRGGRA